MKLVSLFLLFLSLNAIADENFSRMQPENDHYKDYTRDEMTSQFGETKALLPQYGCNGKDEFDFYWMPRKNLKRDSLKILFYKEDGSFTYQSGKYFDANGVEVTDFSDLFIKAVVPVLAKLESIPETNKMLRLLELAPYPVSIRLGGNSFTPKEVNGKNYLGIYMATAIGILDHGRMTSENVPFYDIGVGGLINWNPKNTEFPGTVTLAHEMYHALDSVRGILDTRFIIGDNYEMTQASEYRAVFMENIVRKATGVALRTHYGQDQTGPGVLDENGNPRFISSPCLK